ncbi:hypothetical protein MJO29_000706 [Puccinia striiformis f. sp. tritici]|nr:hypothetical protein MJO29_000706 [Puccinia striiformis f. sp. tritici]
MNFNASAVLALAVSFGAFLAIASPLPSQPLPDGHKCAGSRNCDTLVGPLVKTGDIFSGSDNQVGIIPVTIPMSALDLNSWR